MNCISNQISTCYISYIGHARKCSMKDPTGGSATRLHSSDLSTTCVDLSMLTGVVRVIGAQE